MDLAIGDAFWAWTPTGVLPTPGAVSHERTRVQVVGRGAHGLHAVVSVWPSVTGWWGILDAHGHWYSTGYGSMPEHYMGYRA
jgi:hypothetical protein